MAALKGQTFEILSTNLPKEKETETAGRVRRRVEAVDFAMHFIETQA